MSLILPNLVMAGPAPEHPTAPQVHEEVWAIPSSPVPMLAYLIRPIGGAPFPLIFCSTSRIPTPPLADCPNHVYKPSHYERGRTNNDIDLTARIQRGHGSRLSRQERRLSFPSRDAGRRSCCWRIQVDEPPKTNGLKSRSLEWSRPPEPRPPQAGYWCSSFARRPDVRLIWRGTTRS
jgi:hypothetical protein